MLDEFGQRIFIIPGEVKGFYQARKAWVQSFLLFIFLIQPWLSWDGRQAVLLDIPDRKFYFYGLQLFATDAPLFFLVLVIFVVSLFLLTALYGRVWCGWACPQTVFIERVYRFIERQVEGNYIKRRALAAQDLSFEKIFRGGLKWLLFFAVSSIFAHSFIAYFAGGAQLLSMMQAKPSENSSYFLWVSAVTLLLLFDFGWFREQFCLIVCPYGRFQSVLQDPDTISIFYDVQRGEPRKGSPASNIPPGDCVSCHRCVEVCPTGIDIRNGTQMECIGCTACIDACDEIMTKIHKPTGLIGYRTESGQSAKKLRPRVIIYASVVVIALVTLSTLLAKQEMVLVELLRAKGLPFVVLQDSESRKIVQNQFKLRIENHFGEKLTFKVDELSQGEEINKIFIPGGLLVVLPHSRLEVPVILQRPIGQFAKSNQLNSSIEVRNQISNQLIKTIPVSILGPQAGFGPGSL